MRVSPPVNVGDVGRHPHCRQPQADRGRRETARAKNKQPGERAVHSLVADPADADVGVCYWIVGPAVAGAIAIDGGASFTLRESSLARVHSLATMPQVNFKIVSSARNICARHARPEQPQFTQQTPQHEPSITEHPFHGHPLRGGDNLTRGVNPPIRKKLDHHTPGTRRYRTRRL